MPLRIREAEARDVPSIASIHIRAWQAAYRGQLDDAYLDALDVEERIGQTRSMIEEAPPEFRSWIAEDGADVVGFAVTGPSQDADAEKKTGELYAIYLEPERVGTGVGRTLFEHALADLVERGFTGATLWILESNALGRRFYEAAGWTPDGTTASEHVDTEMRSTIRYRAPF